MKNSILKQPLFVFAAIVTVASLFTSCKKDNEADDPNIVYTVFDKTVSIIPGVTSKDSLDLNLDTKTDFEIIAGKNAAGDTVAAYLIGSLSAGYIDSTKSVSIAYQALPLSNGQKPDKFGTAKRWKSVVIVAYKAGSTVLGFAGAGDQFVPVFVKNVSTGKFHYGWVRVNVNNDYTTYKIIDGAYNLIPETPIEMGAK